MKLILFFIIATTLISSFASETEDKKDRVSIKKSAVLKKDLHRKSSFSQSLSMALSSDAMKLNSQEKRFQTSSLYSLKYKISSEYMTKLDIDFTKNLRPANEVILEDSKLSISKQRMPLYKNLELAPMISLIIPTSTESRKIDSLYFGVEVSPSFLISVSDQLIFKYLPRFILNTHEYKSSLSGASNSQTLISQYFVTSVALSEKLTLDFALIYINQWTYNNKRKTPSYLTNLEVGYSINPSISIAAGTLQGGSLYATSFGVEKKLELYDRNETSLYSNIIVKF